jgi:hypothetical protein
MRDSEVEGYKKARAGEDAGKVRTITRNVINSILRRSRIIVKSGPLALPTV